MRLAAVVMGALLASVAVTAQAQHGLPSQAMLTDMGLSGMQILSDEEAMTIRGSGFRGGVGTAYHFHHSIHKFHKWVEHFHKWVHQFQKRTKHFHHHFDLRHDFGKKHISFHFHHISLKKFPIHRPFKRW